MMIDREMICGGQIRYIKLHFTLEIVEDTVLPRNKASALRGGMGEMLLRMHCIRDRNCEVCDFESECLVRRTMYSKMEIRPDFMSQGDSVGYVIECENYEEVFAAGDILQFNLLLLGKAIVYFSQFLQAFQHLGIHGLGKHRAKYSISRITNTTGADILSENNIYMQRLEVRLLSDYVAYRRRRMETENPENAGSCRLLFHTPLSLKYRGELLQSFDMNAIMEACARRVYIMNCFEGVECEMTDVNGHIPHMIASNDKKRNVRRYSSTHDEKINLQGIRGVADIMETDDTAIDLLLAGELLHIGKNTSFGFGRFTLALRGNVSDNL